MSLPLPLQAARLRLVKDRPYLAAALWALQPVEMKGLGSIGVDMHFRLYYDPDVIEKWPQDELAGVLYHEVVHLLRNHAERMKNFPQPAANIAADMEENDDILKEGMKLPEEPITPETYGLPEGLLAEEYAARLMQLSKNTIQSGSSQSSDNSNLQNNTRNSNNTQGSGKGSSRSNKQTVTGKNDNSSNTSTPKPGAGRCGSCATGRPESWELPAGKGEQPGITKGEADLIRRNVAVAIREAMAARGDVPEHLKRWADGVLTPKVDWRKEPASCVRRTLAEVMGAVDYTYRRPSRRQYSNVIMPSLCQPLPSVAVVVDTSGSISDKMLEEALSEVKGILRSAGIRDGIHVISCDAEVNAVKKVTSVKQVALNGGGGTDMGAGIEAAGKLKPKPSVCIVLTDGYTPWPDSPPAGMKVIVGLLEKENPAWEVPGWAKKVIIEKE